jgi:hypothetical protein
MSTHQAKPTQAREESKAGGAQKGNTSQAAQMMQKKFELENEVIEEELY